MKKKNRFGKLIFRYLSFLQGFHLKIEIPKTFLDGV